jgi:pyridoxal phosphate enzyme (YggS family)
MATIAQALSANDARVAAACEQAGRKRGEVQLLAVSKTFPASAVAQAYAAGQRAFGENYIAEGVDKIAACQAMGLAEARWHCIGPVQSNKTALVAAHFDWVHSIDRLKIAQRLSAQRPANLPPLQVCLQVNVDGEASKSGVSTAELLPLAREVAQLPRLCLRGLMSIPAPRQGFEAQRLPHRILRELFGRCRTDLAMAVGLDASRFDTLSMGMSDDLEAAIAEGATMVRVGRGIFGERATGEPRHA